MYLHKPSSSFKHNTNNKPQRPLLSTMDTLQDCKLTYFGLPGRGEAIRLQFLLAKVKFEDNRLSFADWPATKDTTPWGSLPILELKDGTVLAQAKSISRVVGKLGGLYPTDPFAAGRVDEIIDVLDDIFTTALNNAGRGLEKEAKEAARAEFITTGAGGKALKRLDENIGIHGKGGHVVGNSLTTADLWIFLGLSSLISGFWDGIPPTTLDGYKNIQATRKFVASIPEIAAYYEGRAAPAEVTLVQTKNL
eukprot:m.214474 g.214474  ORF g.214474 m.214474 type:complete len:250 (+) comp33176_c6_seq10:2092-2841(+)